MSEMTEYQRGIQDGRNIDAQLICGRARTAYGELCASGYSEQADAMQAEISRLQSIVCHACEASMDAGRERDEAVDQLTAERAAREAATAAKERAEAECERLKSEVERLAVEAADDSRHAGMNGDGSGVILFAQFANKLRQLLASREDDATGDA